jgi:hypothetical protein
MRCVQGITRIGRRSLSDRNDRRRITDEAIGERPASAIPEAARDRVPESRPATSAGPRASVATRTAEAMGERVGDAYAYPDATADEVQNLSRRLFRRTSTRDASDFAQPLMFAAAGFAVGYMAALLIHRRG